jgi:hypothetical protein
MVLADPPDRHLDRQEVLEIARLGLVTVNRLPPGNLHWLEAMKSIDTHWPEII